MPDEAKPALTLDCIGLYCPEPLFQTRESIDSIEIGDVLEVIADDPAAEEDLKRFAKRAGHEVVSLENDGVELRILLRRREVLDQGTEPERKTMADEKNILYVQTSNLPERQYSPLVLAQSAKAMGLDAAVYYLGMGHGQLGAAEGMQLGSFPSVAEMLKKTMDMGITVYVCEASKQMLGWDTVELIDGVKLGAATLNDLALDADSTMWF